MMYCLKCQDWISQPVTWSTLFLPNEQTQLCDSCQSQLKRIAGTICERCGRQMPNETMCEDCNKWQSNKKYRDTLLFNRSLFQYTPFMQEVITQWKYRGDYQLKDIFSPYIKKEIRNFYPTKSFTIVPIPLTNERLHDRAFNQAIAIAEIIAHHHKNPVIHALSRNVSHSEKQSKKSRQQRITTKNPFFLTKSLETDVLLVDDIYTTGMTIHHAAKLLQEAGCAHIYSFTLVR
ncbi:competence protein ComFC [Gracilibacillus orientalis]|uniref:Competence protein ComFC n=1 Tax=Gracilibacillus orientalis TaxID=334253 RepID=A0A1I4P7W4_9BACI|nr:ComF family protein [Gracilibacillus orientalis]SFM23881.1 competence protein ComFC [Gracilibacillus orientalis]